MPPPPPPPPAPPSRRQFLRRATAASALVVLGNASCELGELAGGDFPASIEVDLALPAFARLRDVGGVAALDAGRKRLLFLRTSASELVALDRLCTHQSCDLDPDAAGRYDAAAGELHCRCHDGKFSSTGAPLGGPVTVPLRRYDVRFDASAGKATVRLT